MARLDAVLKKLDERLAFMEKVLSLVADDMGIDLDAIAVEIAEEAPPDRATLKSMSPAPTPVDVPEMAGSEMEVELPAEMPNPVKVIEPEPEKEAPKRSKKSAAD